MSRCPACQEEIPPDALFCGWCGYRLEPLSESEHRRLSETLDPLDDSTRAKLEQAEAQAPAAGPGAGDAGGGPVLLTRKKPPTTGVAAPAEPGEKKAKKKLQIVGEPAAAEAAPEQQPAPTPSEPPAPEPAADQAGAAEPVEAPPAEPRVTKGNGESDLTADVGEPSGRKHRRFPLKVEVNYTSEHNFYTGFMENLSSGGLFVATHEPHDIGDQVELSFTVPGLAGTCNATCEVRWLRAFEPENPDMVPGVGLKFVRLASEARAAIEMFISHREPIFYDED